MHHSRALALVVLGICLWGVVALIQLPSGIYPDVAFPRIVIIAERGEEAADNMMVAVTRPLEEAVGAVQGLRRVRSKTIRGASEISLDFAPSTDMQEALSQTRARVNAALMGLSPPVSAIVERQTPSVFPVISFNVTLDPAVGDGTIKDGADLLNWARLAVKPRLARLPDVFQVSVQGADERQIQVLADPARLAAGGLTLDDLEKALEQANQVGAVGIIEKDYKQYQVLASSRLKSAGQIADLPLTTRQNQTIHLRDVAQVKPGLADRTSVVTGNGRDSVVVSIFMRYGGKVTELSDNVKATLAELKESLPAGVVMLPVYDQADLVRDSISGVRDAILIGMLLTVVVLWAFLSSWRLTLVAAVSIPISVLATFACMMVLGESLNLMSLGGIAVAIGLIIDNAIVVVENIARKVQHRGERRAAVIEATGEIFGAVVGSSLTTVVVFLPLVLLEGVVGQFFRALAVTLVIGILVSMVVSLTLTPLMGAGPLGPREHERTTRRWMERLAGVYARGSRQALRHPLVSALALVAILGAAGWAAIEQKTGFLPEMDEGAFVLDYRMPVGTSLGETDKNCRRIEAVLAQCPEIASFSRRTGAELGFFATEQFTGDFLAGLKPQARRHRSIMEIIDDLRGRINAAVPQIDIEFIQVMQDTLNDLSGSPAPLEVKVFGSDYRVLQQLAAEIAGRLEKTPGVVDVATGASFGNPELTYAIDSNAASRLGLTDADVQRQLKEALYGVQATELRQGERLVPVWLRYPDQVRYNPDWLNNLPLADGAGHTIPASAVSRLEQGTAINELARENQQPLVEVKANLSGVDLGTAARRVGAMLKQIKTPSDVHIELGGQILSQKQAFRNLLTVLGLACGLVFLLLVIQFRSYRLPLVIFLTLPPSLIAALLALRLTGMSLNISSFMGLVMLIGLVVKNGIIFIEYTAQLRAEGMPTLSEALVQAGRVRLRPILMTSLAAIIAMAPLAFNLGAGAELQRPLAIAVIGGLSVSTLFTLLIVPVAHLLLGEPHPPEPPEERT
jgi:CzcA family heavy metal efflux pump